MRPVFQRSVRGLLLALGLLLASGCGDPQGAAMRELHDSGLKFTVGEFVAAAGRNDLAAVRTLVAAGMGIGSPDAEGTTALIAASGAGATLVAQWLLEEGADPNARDGEGRCALIAAAGGEHVDTIRLLLKMGADPLAKNAEDWSALTLAAFKGNTDAVAVLAPGSVELLDDALLVAAFGGDPEVIDLLLNNGAYVNARSPDQHTPLMIAAMNGHLDAVRLLVYNGANRYALDDDAMTPANFALANGHAETAAFLNQPPVAGEEPEYPGAPKSPFSKDFYDVYADVPDDPGAEAGRRGGGAARAQGVEIRVEEASGEAVVSNFRMRDYRERNLPILLQDVGEKSASVRVLYGNEDPLIVREGEAIADTGLRVVEFSRRFANSKYGKGELVDVSQIVVEDSETGTKHLLLKGLPGKSSETYALMQLDDSGRAFEVRTEDRFTARGSDSEVRLRVVDVRPTQVVIENTVTRESFTIPRAAAARSSSPRG